jgi:hypothetical protein
MYSGFPFWNELEVDLEDVSMKAINKVLKPLHLPRRRGAGNWLLSLYFPPSLSGRVGKDL